VPVNDAEARKTVQIDRSASEQGGSCSRLSSYFARGLENLVSVNRTIGQKRYDTGRNSFNLVFRGLTSRNRVRRFGVDFPRLVSMHAFAGSGRNNRQYLTDRFSDFGGFFPP
jgi:hypothetical protein